MHWHKPDDEWALADNEAQVWKLSSLTSADKIPVLHLWLSAEEKERALRFHFRKDYNTYVIARGMLRYLLGKYMAADPRHIQFFYNEQGKPYIDPDYNLQFNVSHSAETIIIGFVKEHLIGVDIEYNEQPVEVKQVAGSFFSPNEVEALFSLPEATQLESFYNCWTRKEAFIKAKGGGLSIPLDQFEVSLIPGDKPELKSILWDMQDVPNWHMVSFSVGATYTCASMVNSRRVEYRFLDGDQVVLE